jgi:sugar/nucleoside kinase (ribokinase family)
MSRENVVLGLGGTVDYEVEWNSTIIEGLIEDFAIDAAELDRFVPVDSERNLIVAILAHLRDGVGGERFITSSDTVKTFASRFQKRITLGGTCVRAGLAMAKLGIPSTLHLVSIDDTVRRLLPASCTYICSASVDSTDPHLIVQFNGGATAHARDIDLRADHPNRIIFTNDPPNTEMVLSKELGNALRTADAFLISGLNVINERSVLDARLATLGRELRNLPPEAVVVYEDAAFHHPEFAPIVRDFMASTVTVYSMNEDELQSHLSKPVDLLNVDDVYAALRELHGLMPARTTVVHTKYWSLAYGNNAGRWRSGLKGGITMASTRFCYGDNFTPADYEAVGQAPVNSRGAELAAELNQRLGADVGCLPALSLATQSPTTIGLGDSFVGGYIAAIIGQKQRLIVMAEYAISVSRDPAGSQLLAE